jgi:hypothetical protein
MLGVAWSWVFAGLFGWVIPWWFWPAVSIVAGIALYVLIPSRLSLWGFGIAISERSRTILACLLITLGLVVGSGSWGIKRGIETERRTWELRVSQERERLQEENAENLKREMVRASLAEAANEVLRGQINDLTKDTPDGGDIVIPESVTNSLRAWQRDAERGTR